GGTLAGTTTGIQGNILNNGVLIFDQSVDGDYAGLLSGTGGIVLNGTGAIALTNTANTFSGGVTVNAGVLRITSDAALGTGSIILNGGSLDLTLAQLAPGRQLITLGQVQQVAVHTGDFVFTGGILGSGIEKVGLGTLTFNYDNSGFTGDIYVNGGTIRALTAQSFGAATIHMIDPNIQYSATGSYASNIVLEVAAPSSADPSTLTVDAGIVATITGSITQTANGDTVQPLVIDGLGTLVLTNAANSWNGSTTINTGATLQGTAATISGGNIVSNGTLALNQAGDGTFDLDISGTGGVTSIGAAELTLSGTNTYSGRTQINAGTLIAGGGSAIGDTSAVTVAGGATLSLAGSETIGSLVGSGTVRVNANTLTVGGDNASTEFSGSITDIAAVSYVGSWDVTSGPHWSTNPPTYTGQDAAALLFGGSAADYRISTAGADIAAITDTAWYNRYGGNPANFTQLASDARIDTAGAGYNASGDSSAYVGDHASTPTYNYAFTGGQSLGGGLTHVGSGSLILSGTNTYTGQTSIEGGTLEVRNGSAIADTGVVSVSSGATFLVSNAETIGRLTGAGAVNLAGGSLTLANSSGTYSGALSGTGSLVLSGGSLSLGGALINAGGLVLGGTTTASLLSTGSITVAGNAVTMNGTANSFTNAGSVSSSGGTGVTSSGVLTLTNATGGAISGRAGVYAGGLGTVTNAVGASITGGSLNNTVRLAGNGSSLTNAGTISGTTNFSGVFFDGTGTVTNQTGGTISNTSTAVQFAGDGSALVNAGTITSNSGFSGVFFDRTGTVTNQTGGSISNTGTAVWLSGAGSVLDNAGSISNSANASAVYFANSGTVVNQAGGTLTSANARAVRMAGAGASVTNAGLIAGGDAGVYLDGANGSVTNTGTIRVTGGSANTVVSGVVSSAAGSAVTNAGLIDSSLDGGRGIYLAGGTGTITNQSGGTISGNGAGAAIILTGADYALDLQAGSTVNGLIDASATTGINTVTIAGDLNGSYAGGTGADNVTLVGGMTVSGLIDGSSGTDTLILGGMADGALDISQTLGFESRTLTGGGAWTLSGTDSDAADWTLDSGTLRLTGSQSVSDTAGILVNSGATLSIGDSEAIGALIGNGSVVIDASQMLYVGVNGADSIFSGIISGAGSLSQSGTGSLTLYGANTYTGDTRVDAGTLRLGASGVIADSSRLIVQTGATLDMQGFDETVAVAWLNGTVNNSMSPPPSPLMGGTSGGPQAVILPTGTGTLTAADYYLDGATINTNLGTGNLYNTGGVSILNGTAAAGLVSVQAGTLRLGESDRLADTAILSVSANATLDLQGFDETVATAYLNGSLYGANIPFSPRVDGDSKSPELVAWNPGPVGTGTLTAAEYYLDGATVFANLGTGNLFNTGGYSILYGTAAAGLVSVEAGTLLLGVSNRLADTATLSVSSGATLDLRGNDETVGLALINGSLNSSLPNPATPLAAPTLAGGAPLSGLFLGTGTLTALEYQLNGAAVNANLGAGTLFNLGGVSTLTGTAATGEVVVQAGTLRLGASERLADTA
ncbi:autotransporter-associated beta strand repeat-containing protein, partial [Brevundimonas sp.]|uniref:beta strand repeat-containing protein n=1 Tax=Brevundimonas sp. TaxID=1871086 RepID=UPI002488A328